MKLLSYEEFMNMSFPRPESSVEYNEPVAYLMTEPEDDEAWTPVEEFLDCAYRNEPYLTADIKRQYRDVRKRRLRCHGTMDS